MKTKLIDALIKLVRQPFVLILFLSLPSYTYMYKYSSAPKAQFAHDVSIYYSYLPAFFVDNDITFENNREKYFLEIIPETGKAIPKTTMGMAYFYLPSFLVAHTVAYVEDRYEMDGYSKPYRQINHAFSYLLMLLSTWILFKILNILFSKTASYISTICIFFGTNYFFYVMSLGEMSHSYLFFILTLLIYHTFKFHEDPKIINRKSLWIIAFFGGWATLIRPTDILFLLFPLLYNIHDLKLFKQKFILLEFN